MMKFVLSLVFTLGVIFSNAQLSRAEPCEGAQVEAIGFTSDDATIVSKIAYIADFTLSCSNGVKDVSLYAETASGVVGVARSVDGVRYQVSWAEDTDVAHSGEIPIKLYDEYSYASLRKAQRSGEPTTSVEPIATIRLYHSKAYNGPWVNSETLAVLSVIGIYYYAYTQKNVITE